MLGTLNQADRLRCPVQSGNPPGPARRGTRSRLGRAYVTAGVAMIPWLLYLAFTLPASATDGHWALAWVGLDEHVRIASSADGALFENEVKAAASPQAKKNSSDSLPASPEPVFRAKSAQMAQEFAARHISNVAHALLGAASALYRCQVLNVQNAFTRL